MAQTLTAGTRQVPASDAYWAALCSVDVPTEAAAWAGAASLWNRTRK